MKNKKYLNSLKILLEDDDINEGFASLGRGFNFRSSPDAKKCKIELPNDLINYLLLQKKENSEEEFSVIKTFKEKGFKSLITSIPRAGFEIITGFIDKLINDATNKNDMDDLLQLMTLSIPAVHCDLINIALDKIDKTCRSLGIYKIETINTDKKTISFEIINDLESSGKNQILKSIGVLPVDYENYNIIKECKFLKNPGNKDNYLYSILQFSNVMETYFTSNKFELSELKEDIKSIEFKLEDLNNLRGNPGEIYSEAGKTRILNYDKESIFYQKKEKLDKEFSNSEGDSIKKAIISQFINYLITAIEEIFYDDLNKNNIPQDFKNEMDNFLLKLQQKL